MRQGPLYSQRMDKHPDGSIAPRAPLELDEELSKFEYVVWKDNGDGTYTLIPHNDIGRHS